MQMYGEYLRDFPYFRLYCMGWQQNGLQDFYMFQVVIFWLFFFNPRSPKRRDPL